MGSADWQEDVTQLLAASSGGDEAAAARLFPIIYEQLRQLAGAYMRRERADHTLEATALVHEAYLRLVPAAGRDGARGVAYEDRNHFVATAAVAMRRILVNHARAKATKKRGGSGKRLALDDAAAAFESAVIDLLALDEALEHLAACDATQARLVELRFFGGMTAEQCADVLGVSVRTVQYEWAHARAWLRRQLGDG